MVAMAQVFHECGGAILVAIALGFDKEILRSVDMDTSANVLIAAHTFRSLRQDFRIDAQQAIATSI